MKLQKLIVIIALITLMIIMLSKSVLAVTIGDYAFNTDDSGANTSDVQRISNKVLGVIQWVSILLGVIVIAVIGIKFMMGSVEEKSQYKKSMIPLVIGIIVVMGTTTITKTLFNLFNSTGIDSVDVSYLKTQYTSNLNSEDKQMIKYYYEQYNIQAKFYLALLDVLATETTDQQELHSIQLLKESVKVCEGDCNQGQLARQYGGQSGETAEQRDMAIEKAQQTIRDILKNVDHKKLQDTLNNMQAGKYRTIAIAAFNNGLIIDNPKDNDFLALKD